MERLSEEEEAALLRRALLHDLHEARIGDLTPEQKRMERPDEAKTERQMLKRTHLEQEIELLQDRKLSLLSRDSDKLDMLFRAIENANAGNKNMQRFIDAALKQIKSESGKKLAKMALARMKK